MTPLQDVQRCGKGPFWQLFWGYGSYLLVGDCSLLYQPPLMSIFSTSVAVKLCTLNRIYFRIAVLNISVLYLCDVNSDLLRFVGRAGPVPKWVRMVIMGFGVQLGWISSYIIPIRKEKLHFFLGGLLPTFSNTITRRLHAVPLVL